MIRESINQLKQDGVESKGAQKVSGLSTTTALSKDATNL